jgi:hypothetical protein
MLLKGKDIREGGVVSGHQEGCEVVKALTACWTELLEDL